jgi:nucleoside-diphosphate-sugar epimerase
MDFVATGPIEQYENWPSLLTEVRDVVHLAAYADFGRAKTAEELATLHAVNIEATRQLALAAVAQGVRRLIFLSTIKVNGEFTTGDPFNSGSPCWPSTDYAKSKFKAEQALRETVEGTATRLVILRVPLVYGGEPRHNLSKLINLVERGVPLPFASINNRRHMLALPDLLQLIQMLVTLPDIESATWVVADDEPWSIVDMVAVIASVLKVAPRQIPVPRGLLVNLLSLIGKGDAIRSLVCDLEVDATAVRQRFSLATDLSRVDVLAMTVNHYKNNRRTEKAS